MKRPPLFNFIVVFAFLSAMTSAEALASSDCPYGGDVIDSWCHGITEDVIGCCTANGSYKYCYDGHLCEEDCGTGYCGWDEDGEYYDCGDVMSGDPYCIDNYLCPDEPACEPCDGALTIEGCCDGTKLRWCECDCVREIECASDGCGWRDSPGFYMCGESGSDPDGLYPMQCNDSGCIPDCYGKNCGDNGCDGSCGECSSYFDEVCWEGWCCTPDCDYAECGNDGCGGSCGSCPTGETCDELYQQCISDYCVPDCNYAECGDDGCGGSCGSCQNGETCNETNGTCVALGTCVPDCAEKECGPDNCDGTCGSCSTGYSCLNGSCVKNQACVPNCEGKDCGPDDCGGSCGTCQKPLSCSDDGYCFNADSCVTNCTNKTCGHDGCGGSCGECQEGYECDRTGNCVTAEGAPDSGADTGATFEDYDVTETRCADSACPAGTVSSYGQCVAAPQNQVTEVTDGGCSAGPAEGQRSSPVILLVFLMLFMLGRGAAKDKEVTCSAE